MRHQRPKIDHYAGHLFLACHSARLNLDKATLETTEIDAFISQRWLITVRKDDGFAIDPVMRRWDRSAQLVKFMASVSSVRTARRDRRRLLRDRHRFDDYYDEVSDGIFSERPLDPRSSATGSRCAGR